MNSYKVGFQSSRSYEVHNKVMLSFIFYCFLMSGANKQIYVKGQYRHDQSRL